jgi:acyl-coenzyme A synthetase/AMP-(fatty) acid ligase
MTGQKPVGFVMKKPGHALDAEAVRRVALANAPAYQHPRFVWFVDELPLASTNKLDRAALHAMAEERMAKE